MLPLPAIAAGLAVAFAGGLWAGIEWQQGRQASTELAEREKQDTRRTLTFGAEAERLAEQTDTIALAQKLEAEAYAQPVAADQCLPVERVLRLDRRGRSAP